VTKSSLFDAHPYTRSAAVCNVHACARTRHRAARGCRQRAYAQGGSCCSIGKCCTGRSRPRQSGNEDHGAETSSAQITLLRAPRGVPDLRRRGTSFSEPKLCPLSKVIKVVEGVMRRNEMSGKRALDVSSFRMGEDSAEYIGSVLRKTRPVTLNSSTAP